MKLKIVAVSVTTAVFFTMLSSVGFAQGQKRITQPPQKARFLVKSRGDAVSATPISIPRTFDGTNPHFIPSPKQNPALDPGLGP